MISSDYNYRAYKILFFDDESQALKYFAKAFGDTFRIQVASSAKEAWLIIEEKADEFGVVISDQRMQGERGVDLLASIQNQYPDIVRILTTAYSDLESAIDAVNRGGAFAYVNKPWQLEGLRGTLKRAMEHFLIRRERDRLLREKLSTLQRMLVMDRVRGLATLAALLKDRLRDPTGALSNYIRQANLGKQLADRAEALAEIDLMSAIREECQHLILALEKILADVAVEAAEEDQPVDLARLLKQCVDHDLRDHQTDGVNIRVDVPSPSPVLHGNPVLLRRLISTLIERISEMDRADITIHVSVQNLPEAAQLELRLNANTAPWENGQVASLYSALIPFREWPMGIDMDILSAFLIAHHHGGSLELINQAPFGPGFCVKLALMGGGREESALDPSWLHDVLRNLEAWRAVAV